MLSNIILTPLAGQGYTEADFFTAETDPKTFYSVQPPADDEEPKEKEAQEKK